MPATIQSQNTWHTNRLSVSEPLSSDSVTVDNETLVDDQSCVISDDVRRPLIQHHRHVQVDIVSHQTHYCTGHPLAGHLLVSVSSSATHLRCIGVEVMGLEHIADGPSRVFYQHSSELQSVNGPPSDAVQPDVVPDAKGYRPAIRGQRRLKFHLPIPEPLPSSVQTAHGSIRYLLTAKLGVRQGVKGREQVLSVSKVVNVYQSMPFNLDGTLSVQTQSTSTTWGLLNGRGPVALTCTLERSLHVAGTPLYVAVSLANQSNKKPSKIGVKLIQRVKTFRPLDDEDRLEPVKFKREKVASVKFAAEEWDLSSSHATVFDLTIPSWVRTVKCGEFLEVTYAVQVCVKASLSTTLVLEFPIDVCHSSSIVPPRRALFVQPAQRNSIIAVHELIDATIDALEPSVEQNKTETVSKPTFKKGDSAFQSELSLPSSSTHQPDLRRYSAGYSGALLRRETMTPTGTTRRPPPAPPRPIPLPRDNDALDNDKSQAVIEPVEIDKMFKELEAVTIDL